MSWKNILKINNRHKGSTDEAIDYGAGNKYYSDEKYKGMKQIANWWQHEMPKQPLSFFINLLELPKDYDFDEHSNKHSFGSGYNKLEISIKILEGDQMEENTNRSLEEQIKIRLETDNNMWIEVRFQIGDEDYSGAIAQIKQKDVPAWPFKLNSNFRAKDFRYEMSDEGWQKHDIIDILENIKEFMNKWKVN
tara:strand:+ start:60 stop:635 length:576 start_codon:yes stop_codon:yes gene_type:complete